MKTVEEYLEELVLHPDEPISWYGGNDYLTMKELVENYAKERVEEERNKNNSITNL